MEREIKFRGKRADNGEWVQGYFVEDGIYFIWSHDEDDFITRHSVDPDTLGQFTGLTDRNGKEIYEGDIVKYDETPYNAYASPYSGEVVFYCGSWRVKTKGYGVEWVYPYLFRDDFANRKTELLGNIHDNPELITNHPNEL